MGGSNVMSRGSGGRIFRRYRGSCLDTVKFHGLSAEATILRRCRG